MLRLLIADDHEMVRQGLRAVLSAKPGWEICGEAATGREAVEKARQLRPHLAILDITMPELNGLEAARQIRQTLPTTEVLVLTMHESEELVRELLAAGVRGYLLKSDAGRLLVEAVESVRQGKPFFTGKIAELVLAGYLDPEKRRQGRGGARLLTSREREIVQLIAEAKSTKEIADALGISVKTAETHRTNLMRKLKVRTVSQVVRYAIRNRIIEA
jgi:DNA-binding NarL/FixJ family response regulator